MDQQTEKTATPELSKRVLDDRKDGDRLAAMGREHAAKVGRTVGEAIGAQYATMAEAIVTALAERTALLTDEMVTADVALTVELADDAAPRNDRDHHEKATREAIVDVRERVVGMYGQGMLSTMLLASGAPKDPKQLVTYATRAADVIAKMEPGSFPESKIEGGKPSPKKWATLLRKPADSLDTALDSVDRELAEAITALTARNEKRDAVEAFIPKASTLLEGFLRFGGMNAEADRLDRPVSTTQTNDAPVDGATGDAPSADAPTATTAPTK